MKYTVVCVGKLKERFWKDACAEYTKRLGAYAKVDIREVADIDPAKAGGVDAARDKEGAAILASLAISSACDPAGYRGQGALERGVFGEARRSYAARQQRHRLCNRRFGRRE